MSRQARNAKETDQNVLTIFLPLLAVALLACAGACFYMEKRRKQKLKSGMATLQDEHFNDASSIISTNSRRRSYLQSNGTAGRNYRSASRTGSIRSGYNFSSYGEPPPYSGKASRRTSLASVKALEEDKQSQRRGFYNDGFSGSRRSLSRSRSLLDLNNEFDPTPMRRTRSSSNIRRYSLRDNAYASEPPRSRYDDDIRSQRSAYDMGMNTGQRSGHLQMSSGYDQPLPTPSLPAGRRSSMRRSMSQPNLRNKIGNTRTYPQGILKPNGLAPDGFNRGPSSVAGDSVRGGMAPNQARRKRRWQQNDRRYGMRRKKSLNSRPNGLRGESKVQMKHQSRPTSRLGSGFSPEQKGYDVYSGDAPLNYTTFPRAPPGKYDNPSLASGGPPNPNGGPPNPGGYNQPPGTSWTPKFAPASFDPYNVNDNYWEYGSTNQGAGTQNAYSMYGSMIY